MDQGASEWHKSSYSAEGTQCIEQGVFPGGMVAVRDTKDNRTGPVLTFCPDEWAAFVSFASGMDA